MSALVCHPEAECFDFSSTTTRDLSNRYNTVIRKLRCLKEQWFLSDKILQDLTNKMKRINKLETKDLLWTNQRSSFLLTLTMRKYLMTDYLPSLRAQARTLHQELRNRGLFLRRFTLEETPHELPVRSSESYVVTQVLSDQGHSQSDSTSEVDMDTLDPSASPGATCRLANAPLMCSDSAAQDLH